MSSNAPPRDGSGICLSCGNFFITGFQVEQARATRMAIQAHDILEFFSETTVFGDFEGPVQEALDIAGLPFVVDRVVADSLGHGAGGLAIFGWSSSFSVDLGLLLGTPLSSSASHRRLANGDVGPPRNTQSRSACSTWNNAPNRIADDSEAM